MDQESEQAVAEVLEAIGESNLLEQHTHEAWHELVSEYFVLSDSVRPPDENEVVDTCTVQVHALDQHGQENDKDETEVDDGPLVITDPTEEAFKLEEERCKTFRCECQQFNGGPCSKRYTPDQLMDNRTRIMQVTSAQKDLILLGVIATVCDNSEKLNTPKKGEQEEADRHHQKSHYMLQNQPVCRATFKFIYCIGQDKLTAVISSYIENGLLPRERKAGGYVPCSRNLTLEDVKRVVDFISAYAEIHGLALPGRVSSHCRGDIILLPSSSTKIEVFRRYVKAIAETAHRVVSESSFRSLWLQLLPRVVFSRPLTDMCWECQRNYRDISTSSNLSDSIKAAKLLRQQKHLETVQKERAFYQNLVKLAKEAYYQAGKPELGPHPFCCCDLEIHVSFDYAAQIHLPSLADQPGPLYFLCERKTGLFGICMECIPCQVNYLIDESHCISKGSNAVISYLNHYFENYCLGGKVLNLHCDNCSGQNKNRYMLAYLMWLVLTGRFERITLNFLITGHTKFAPDWCFGLLKQRFRRENVYCLNNLADTVSRSSTVNMAQLVGDEAGNVLVPSYDWQSFLTPFSKPFKGIKSHHHFEFRKDLPGKVIVKQYVDSPEETVMLLTVPLEDVPTYPPDSVPSPGLSTERQWYLYKRIREFCTEETKDILCPKPPEPENRQHTDEGPAVLQPSACTTQAVPDTPQDASRPILRPLDNISQADMQPIEHSSQCNRRRHGRGRGCGRGLGRGTGEIIEEGGKHGKGRPSGRTRGRPPRRGRGRGRGRPPQDPTDTASDTDIEGEDSFLRQLGSESVSSPKRKRQDS